MIAERKFSQRKGTVEVVRFAGCIIGFLHSLFHYTENMSCEQPYCDKEKLICLQKQNQKKKILQRQIFEFVSFLFRCCYLLILIVFSVIFNLPHKRKVFDGHKRPSGSMSYLYTWSSFFFFY